MQEGKLYKQVDEKHLYTEVDLMLWSPKMDLVAVTTTSGEVILHRLSWQKVWLLSPLKENVSVSSLAWRPDGRVLAIGYDNGVVRLCNVEKAQRMYEHCRTSHAITSLTWTDDRRYERECAPDELARYFKPEASRKPEDDSSLYLPGLPPLNPKSAGGGKSQDASLLEGQEGLNVLLVGNAAGELELFAFGFVPVARIVVPGARPTRVLSAVLSARMNGLTVLSCEGEGRRLVATSYSCRELNARKEEVRTLAARLGRVAELEGYLAGAVRQMNEVYEDILFEFETKMRKYAEEKRARDDRSLRTELLRFFLYGRASDDLKCFLQFELKKQSLTRLGTSVHNSYGHIKRLIIRNVHGVCEAILFHLEKVDGMAKDRLGFGRLGLDGRLVSASILDAVELLLKSHEMLQVIDDTVRRFDAFFKWFYPAKLRLSGEPVPQGTAEWTDRDVDLIVDFIAEYFKPDARLERVGQYLKDEDLANPIDDPENLWKRFLETASEAFKESTAGLLPEVHSGRSLVQAVGKFRAGLGRLVESCSERLQQSFEIRQSVVVADFDAATFPSAPSPSSFPRFSVTSCADDSGTARLALMPRAASGHLRSFYHVRTDFRSADSTPTTVERVSIVGGRTGAALEIVDVAFYDDKTLCVLFNGGSSSGDDDDDDCDCCDDDGDGSKIVHLDVADLDSRPAPASDATSGSVPHRTLAADSFKEDAVTAVVERFRASQFAVSGERKVACVLYSSRKRIRLFLTEWEDDGDASAAAACMQVDETARPLDDCPDVDSTLRVSDITIDSPDDNDKENSAVV